MQMNLEVIILAGGSGSRLWPVSRSMRPKQFLNIHGESNMLRNTISRLNLTDINSITVICNEEHRFFVSDQLQGINIEKNITLATELIESDDVKEFYLKGQLLP